MCEVLTPIQELIALKWAVSALADVNGEPGSCAKENARNAAIGIKHRIDWVINTLMAAGEGAKNMGV